MNCFWCGSRETFFNYYECWEEDDSGHPIHVNDLAQAERFNVTIRSEEWWCNDCDGGFGWEYEYPEDDASEGEDS